MRAVIRNFDVHTNFWESNKNFVAVAGFSEFYKNDKSKKKQESSDIMWSIAILIDQHPDNPLKNVSYNDKILLISEDYFCKFDVEKYSDLISLYKNLCLTQIERSIYDIGLKLEERDEFLMNKKYTLDNAKDLDVLISNTKKLKDLYDGMIEELEKQNAMGGQTKGGRIESAGERGEL